MQFCTFAESLGLTFAYSHPHCACHCHIHLIYLHLNVIQEGMSPVHFAAEKGHVSILKILIQKYHASAMVEAGVSGN